MYFLDEISDKSLRKLVLYLTFSEAMELNNSLDYLLKKPLNNHAHISCKAFTKEITVSGAGSCISA